jgi:methyl-accepting chemotaxis protein
VIDTEGDWNMTDSIRKIQDHTDTLRDFAGQLADRIDHVAGEVDDASSRLGKKLGRVNEALAEASRSSERPAGGVASALDDLAHEARRSLERITRAPRKSWWGRLVFWR